MKFIRSLYLILVVPAFIYGADAKFSQTIYDRHQEMTEYYQTQEKKPDISIWDRKYLLGNWGGIRKDMAARGITVAGTYVTDDVANPIGGEARGFSYAGSIGVDLDFDFEKLCGKKGLDFYIAMVFRSGNSLSGKKIGNQFPVQQVYGGQNFRFDQIFFRQRAFNDKLVIDVGRLNAADDFLQSPLYYKYVSNAFDGNPIGVFFNNTFNAYPNATWGAIIKVNLPKFEGKFGVYNGNKNVSANRWHGLNFHFSSTDGAQLTSELGYIHDDLPGSKGYPGHYRVGGYYFTKAKEHFLGGQTNFNYGYYFLVDQAVFRTGYDGLITPFVALLLAPKNRNMFPFFLSSGIVFQGLIQSRPKDFFSLGCAYGKYSSDLSKREEQNKANNDPGEFGIIPQSFETVLEMSYMFQINQWCEIQPDIQYVINPKGKGTVANALVIGMQTKLVF
ncbi:MAG: carbohydrate porin [Rhabdochlamydiaceae bacterium]|nr:carbohydrate porin [Candidatus Amphrikana amoebophyrae]